MRARKWVIAKRFDGKPDDSNFELVEEELPPLKDGEMLCEAIYLSVDPYMRHHYISVPYEVGDVMIGQQVARVTESKHPGYPVGTLVLLYMGWRSHAIADDNVPTVYSAPGVQKVTEHLGDLDPSLALGIVGMPGAVAYFGVTDVLKPKSGEVLFVNAAAGAIGSLVGQIGKILGCKVIGCSSSKEKNDWLKELGFDYVFNYRECDLDTALTEGAPDGIDCYFDSVGGHFTATVLKHMGLRGRMVACGSISQYSDKQSATGPYPWLTILDKELTVTGFNVYAYQDQFPTAFRNLAQWIREGKVKVKEHRTQGFENMPRAFMDLFKSANTGKAIVKA